MKLLFFLLCGGLICFIILMIWAEAYTYSDPKEDVVFTYPDEPLLQHDKLHGNPEDEHDPSHLDLDKSLKIINLRSKLRKIESEKNDIDLDYSSESGK
jgi:hypothetical protein